MFFFFCVCVFFVQAEDGIRDLVRSRGLGDVYKRQHHALRDGRDRGDRRHADFRFEVVAVLHRLVEQFGDEASACLLYTSDAADERSSVDLGGRRIIKKKNTVEEGGERRTKTYTNRV